MIENNTLINIDDDKVVKLIVGWIWKLTKYVVPSGLISFILIEPIPIRYLIAALPSILATTSYILKTLYRWWFIKRKIDKTFGKSELLFDGHGFYFLDLTENLKNLKSSEKALMVLVNESSYLSKFKVSYSALKNRLSIKSETHSGGVKSSYSEAFFSYVRFSENGKDFHLYFTYDNEKHSLATLNSSEIHNLKNHIGYGQITVKDFLIKDFTYVCDFTDRFSFGSFSLKNNNMKILENGVMKNDSIL